MTIIDVIKCYNLLTETADYLSCVRSIVLHRAKSASQSELVSINETIIELELDLAVTMNNILHHRLQFIACSFMPLQSTEVLVFPDFHTFV